MKPVSFEGQNTVFIADGCDDLPAYTDGKTVISCWELTDDEVDEVIATGRVYLHVMAGGQQPPVLLTGNLEYEPKREK